MDPLSSFHPATRGWFKDNFQVPTRVQELGWPRISAGDHTLMLAPTGSGKTLAAFLSVIDRLIRLPVDAPEGVRVVYVSPLKALVYDIERNLRAPLVGISRVAARLGEPIRRVNIDVRTGDTSQKERVRQKRHPADILVITPESLYLLLTSQARETLRSVQTVIVDEIHVMAATKRGVHLGLTLERLSWGANTPVQRVGLSATQRPLERIAAYLGGDRLVQVVDTSEPPNIDLSIVVPVEDMENPSPPDPTTEPGATLSGPILREGTHLFPSGGSGETGIWPSIYPKLLELIRSHRSTIVFTNSRLLCERLSRRLNEMAGVQTPGEELVLAHHGSISYVRRREIEDRLKRGDLPALVATSSLELGIDMGAVDLVVLVSSPGSVARGLQRVGRAGHGVGEVSVGRIFPKYRGDLLECAVVTQHMLTGRIEETTVPSNCLDVLAQQVVAMCAMDTWQTGELEAVIRRACSYRDLTADLFVSVLDMLSGRYPSTAFSQLAPRINWDRANGELTPRRSARLLSVLNGGTIADRGLYRVQLGEGGPRVGELDEEMVYETRTGDNIILGASTWRVEQITRDKVIVSPAPGMPGRLPFWHGERPGRPAELGRALGAFCRELEAVEAEHAVAWVKEKALVDDLAAANLVRYVHEQRENSGIPTDKRIVVERFRDELGDWRVCVLSPFGARVHAPWALAIAASLSEEAGFDVQVMHSDDGIAVRFSDADDLPEVDAFFPDPDEVEELLLQRLGDSAMFASRFRENAGRALLLPKNRADGRTPLWLQRKRSADLLAVARQFPGFPIVLETFRECMKDVFDLPGLTTLLRDVRSRAIAVEEVQTNEASPFARSLIFQFVAAYLYDGDTPLAERRAAALALDRNLLRELLGQEQLRDLLDPVGVAEVEAELGWRTSDRSARHADAVHDLLRRLGDLSPEEVTLRCDGDGLVWLKELEHARRAVQVRIGGAVRWISAEDGGRYRDALGVVLPAGVPDAFLESVDQALESLVLRFARTHGPFPTRDLASRLGLAEPVADALLRGLVHRSELLHGDFRPGGILPEWCHPEVLRRLKRRSLARLRNQVAPVDDAVFARFLPRWHDLDTKRGGVPRLEDVLRQLEGKPIAVSALFDEVLPARIPGFHSGLLDQLGAMGGLSWIGHGALGPRDGLVALYRRDRVPLLVDPPSAEPEGGPVHLAIVAHLRTRGASFLAGIHQAVSGRLEDVVNALWDLVWAGQITNDTLAPLSSLRAKRKQGRSVGGGRWSLVSEMLGAPASPTECGLARVMTLVERYGILGPPMAAVDDVPGGFTALYPFLRELEEMGRLRRGHFVAGLRGAQFALAGAVDRLRGTRRPTGEVRVLAATDPAQVWGSVLPWPTTEEQRPRLRRVAGAKVVTVDGVPVLYVAANGRKLVTLPAARQDGPELEVAVKALNRAVIAEVDGEPAVQSPLLSRLLSAGFARDYRGLRLG